MALWQMDIVGGMFLADGTEAKVVTGVDGRSRYCVIASAVARGTGRPVCVAFASALRDRTSWPTTRCRHRRMGRSAMCWRWTGHRSPGPARTGSR